MYTPRAVGKVFDTERREIKVSIDHGVVRIDALGGIIFLTRSTARLLSLQLEYAVSEATADA